MFSSTCLRPFLLVNLILLKARRLQDLHGARVHAQPRAMLIDSRKGLQCLLHSFVVFGVVTQTWKTCSTDSLTQACAAARFDIWPNAGSSGDGKHYCSVAVCWLIAMSLSVVQRAATTRRDYAALHHLHAKCPPSTLRSSIHLFSLAKSKANSGLSGASSFIQVEKPCKI